MERNEAIRESARLMNEIAKRSRKSENNWQKKGEDASLILLYRRGGSALPGEMAQASGVSSARVAAMLRQMEAKGLITRSADAEDRRRVPVRLTEAGTARAAELMEKLLGSWGRLIDSLGEEDSEAFIRILNKVLEMMETENCCKAEE